MGLPSIEKKYCIIKHLQRGHCHPAFILKVEKILRYQQEIRLLTSPSGLSLCENLDTTSWASAFIGAT